MFSAYFMQEFVWELFISSNQNDFFLIILNRIWHDLKSSESIVFVPYLTLPL